MRTTRRNAFPRNVRAIVGRNLHLGPKTKRKVVEDDDDSDTFIPDAMDVDEPDDDDIGSISAEEASASSNISARSTPEPIARKVTKSKLSKFTASAPASSSPASATVSTPKPALGAFGQPLDKGERLRNFQEKNKDRYSWLLDVRDKEGNRPGDENYDPRSLYIPPGAWKTFTAFEKQYWSPPLHSLLTFGREVKQNLWDTVLFFQKGKFFELYENDATIGHQQFDLKLTDRTNMRYKYLLSPH